MTDVPSGDVCRAATASGSASGGDASLALSQFVFQTQVRVNGMPKADIDCFSVIRVIDEIAIAVGVDPGNTIAWVQDAPMVTSGAASLVVFQFPASSFADADAKLQLALPLLRNTTLLMSLAGEQQAGATVTVTWSPLESEGTFAIASPYYDNGDAGDDDDDDISGVAIALIAVGAVLAIAVAVLALYYCSCKTPGAGSRSGTKQEEVGSAGQTKSSAASKETSTVAAGTANANVASAV